MKRFSAAMTVVFVAASLTLVLVTAPAGAAGGKAPKGDTTTEVEVPRKVERRAAKALKALEELPEDAKPQQGPCWFGVGWCSKAGTDTGYLDCGGVLLQQIGVSWKANRGYDTIHLVPTNLGRASSRNARATIAGTQALYGDMHRCLDLHNLRVTVRNWNAVWQQLHCHIVYQIVGGGGSWDLEGHRRSSWRYLNPFGRCAW